MVSPLSLKILRRVHDGENHHLIEEAEDCSPRRARYREADYFPLRSRAYQLRQEDDC
jgi:hypothetical protein